MKILYDHQTFSIQKYGGISRYFFELINYYEKSQSLSWELAVKNSDNAYLKKSDLNLNIGPGVSAEDFCFGLNFRGKGRIHKALTQLKLADHHEIKNKNFSINKIKQGQFDILHPTYYDPYFYKHMNNKKFVLTIYDMIHELYAGGYFSQNDNTIKYKKFLAEKADRIIAISENTKKDIINLYKIDEKKISVVHLASSLSNLEISDDKINQRYILYVGDRHHYKNFIFCLKSVSKLLLEDKELLFVCGGSIPFNKNEMLLIKELNLEGRVIHRPIKHDSTLASLYQNALCFVFPSLYEGFGIPVLEALSCGCPAVLSNTSSLPEVGGDAAIYFNPEDSRSILDAVKSVVYNNDIADNLRKKGYEQLKKFSWRKCAVETKKVYEDVIS